MNMRPGEVLQDRTGIKTADLLPEEDSKLLAQAESAIDSEGKSILSEWRTYTKKWQK